MNGKEKGIPLRAVFLSFLCRCFAYFAQGSVQFVLVNGFKDIVVNTVLHGFACVFKLPETGDDDALGGRIRFGYAPNEL